MQIKSINQLIRYIMTSFIACIVAWIMTLVVYPYLNPILDGLNRTEAIRDTFLNTSLFYSIAVVIMYYVLITFVSMWTFDSYYQVITWGILLGIYIGIMYMPSYTSQNLSEWSEAHLPKILALICDIFLLVGLPFIVASGLRCIFNKHNRGRFYSGRFYS